MDVRLSNQYKLICLTLKSSIKEAKTPYYNSKTVTSKNSIKRIWQCVKSLTGRNCSQEIINNVRTNNILISDSTTIPHHFNKYYLSIADRINTVNRIPPDHEANIHRKYLFQIFKNPFPKIKINKASKFEVKQIIK